MPENKVTVIARFVAKPETATELRKELLGVISPTRAEEGCINYDLHRDPNDPTRFMFHETWISKKALDQHLNTPHLQALQEKTEKLLAEPLDMTLWQTIEPPDPTALRVP